MENKDKKEKDEKMTDDEYILAEIRPYIAYELEVPEDMVTMDAHFANDLVASSLDMVEIAMEFEKKFMIDISDEEQNGLQTVGDLVRLIKSKQDEKGPSAMVLFFMTRGGKKLSRKTPRKPADKFVMPQKPMMFNPGKKR